MTSKSRPLSRLAIAIHERLQANQPTTANVPLPTGTWQQCELLWRRMQRAQQRGWQLASERLECDLRDSLEQLLGELNTIATRLEPPLGDSPWASIADIRADLAALQEEFEDVQLGLRDRTLSVTTEPIELEGVYLGRFEIRLDWSDLTDGPLHHYQVIAVDAQPAATNEGVTHPHIQDEVVCEGDGRRPIRQALRQGRLLDFFVIVANLLRTYNADSPFVSLADWYGVECADCGSTVGDDERWTCERCGVLRRTHVMGSPRCCLCE